MKLKTLFESELEQILNHPIRGNAWQDMKLMNRIHEFVMDSRNAMEDKIRALGRLDEVMGETDKPVTQSDVEEYIQFHQEEDASTTS